jgi:indolepyruvate ferredoxin oxidoreductase beta subunit
VTSVEAPRAPSLSTDRPITIAILAMGGQGGGVLCDWIVAMAETRGYAAQSTSVPGVAQRTGATIYYIELLRDRPGLRPVFALMPTPGDVDIVLAAEFMEAGRSMTRGLVTPDRTVLIASTHRAFSVSEKEKPGDGIADPAVVFAAAGIAAKRAIGFDMQTLAEANGTVISATLFGALAGADVLPFPREAYEDAIRAGGRGAEPSLRGFAEGFSRARQTPLRADAVVGPTAAPTGATGNAALDALLARIARAVPEPAQAFARAGVARLVDYQDVAYADAYLDRLAPLVALDHANGGADKAFALSTQAAKYLAGALSYDDVIRVADLKTRASRFARVRREVGAKDGQIVAITEYMHPRMEEVLGTLPSGLGHALEARPKLVAMLDRIVNRGRRVRTDTILWFLTLHIVAGLKGRRLGSLRHEREMAHVAHWLDVVVETAPRDYDLAVEALACRRLVKGYSDTHARGLSKFDRVLAQVPFLAGRPDGAAWLRRLKDAALADEAGVALDGAVKTARSAYEA